MPRIRLFGMITPPLLESDICIKGWINFSGIGVIAITDSYNVSTITDDGTGKYTVIWDKDFADTNFVNVIAAGENGMDASAHVSTVSNTNVRTFTSSSGTATDATTINLIAIGNR